MRIFIIDSCYPAFLQSVYTRNPGLDVRAYDDQWNTLMAQHFGTANYYSQALRTFGHVAWESVVNSEPMQLQWAKEHHLHVSMRLGRRTLRGLSIPWLKKDWVYPVLAAQIADFEPDVVLNHHIDLDQSWLRSQKHTMKWLVAQHAAMPLDGSLDWTVYDLALSSFPPTVQWFREHGVRAQHFRLGFEPSVVVDLPDADRTIPVSFVGSFAPVHSSRTEFLGYLARKVPLKVWGPLPSQGFADVSLQRSYQGEAWGSDMFSVLGRSRIVVNHHGNVPPFANNMRLFEATGSGALLVTDWKSDLHEIFDVGTEVVAYRDEEEAARLVEYFMAHESERAAIARAGQARARSDHTYLKRMRELTDLLEFCAC